MSSILRRLRAVTFEPPALQRVVVLLFVNLGLSVALTALVVAFRDSVVDYQLAHLPEPPGADIEAARSLLQTGVWTRVGTVLLASLVYVYLAHRLRQGRRGAYRRVVLISVIGPVALTYAILTAHDPLWMRIEQGVQGVVLLALLWSVTRPELRARFAKDAVVTSS